MFFFIKITKKGYYLPAGADVASGTGWRADVARGTIALMRRGTEATWQGSGWPGRGAGGAEGANTWQWAMRPHGSTWAPVWGATWQEGGVGR